MVDGPLARFFWRAVDAVDYWLMQARLAFGRSVRLRTANAG
jgi:hypothetical protein